MGEVTAISVADRRGIKKKNVDHAQLKENYGIVGDAHAGDWHRQVSLLTEESMHTVRQKGLNVHPGDFAENICVKGVNLLDAKIGTKIRIGEHLLLEVSQIGKVCHTRCHIYYETGDCIMPREGIFTKVLKGGMIKPTDHVWLVEN